MYIILGGDVPLETHDNLDHTLIRLQALEERAIDPVNTGIIFPEYTVVEVLGIEYIKFSRCYGCNAPLHRNNKSTDNLFCNACVCKKEKK